MNVRYSMLDISEDFRISMKVCLKAIDILYILKVLNPLFFLHDSHHMPKPQLHPQGESLEIDGESFELPTSHLIDEIIDEPASNSCQNPDANRFFQKLCLFVCLTLMFARMAIKNFPNSAGQN